MTQVTLVVFAAVVGAAGCQDNSEGTRERCPSGAACPPTSPGSGAESNTPRVRSGAKDLEPRLLTTRDVITIPGLEDLREATPGKTPAFENPDPRAPCGAKIRPPDLNKGALRMWARRDLTASEIVLRPGISRARDYLDSMLADTVARCPAFNSKTNTGATQRVRSTIVHLPAFLGDQRSAYLATVDIEGQRAYMALALVRRGDLIVVVQVVALDAISEATLRDLATQADAATQRLAQQPV